MNIKFRRVLSVRAKSPGVVLATVDDQLVRWQPGEGWTCDCDEDQFPDCPHMPAVESLLDPRVLGADDA
ncbi:hypothetical protein [Segeticoccus rhizosphaerae]|uniref:hypothetical protein n=1 Tax=Segeticoccus rhizosphaerae TaxID=1104777 RepID=UPI0010BFC7A7|nr:hypothetical protein [Ornithinicoccus soli]